MNTVYLALASGILFGAVITYWLCMTRGQAKLQKELRDRQGSFVALASHYLRTPVSIIQLAAGELDVGEATLTHEARTRLNQMVQQGNARLQLISEQLIMVAEAQKGKLETAMAPTNLVTVVQRAVASIDPLARERDVQVTVQVPNEEVTTSADARQLTQALAALLDNAVKFSPKGTPVLIRLAAEPTQYVLTVSDAGKGVTKEQLAVLGQPFDRTGDVYTFDNEGLGLGCYVAQVVASAHGGTLSFAAGYRQGLTAELTLPRES